MSWNPQEAGLGSVIGVLQAFEPTSAEYNPAQAQQRLDEYAKNPEFGMYLAYLMSNQVGGVGLQVRQMSGLVLKNVVAASYKGLGEEPQKVIKQCAAKALTDTEQVIRNAAGIVTTTIITRTGLRSWQELLPALLRMLESNEPHLVDGAFRALLKITEDSSSELDSEELGRPLNVLVPIFLRFFHHPSEAVRGLALGCMNNLILLSPEALLVNMPGYLAGLSHLTQDASAAVRKSVCQAIITMLEVSMRVTLQPQMPNIIEFMLHAQQDPDPEVAKEAGEFWLVYCEQGAALELLEGVLDRLIPALLKCMVYSEEQIAEFQAEDPNDTHIPDRPEDIRPMFHHSKRSDDFGEGDDEDSAAEEWTLRKCAATALDEICSSFGPDAVLPVLLPELEKMLVSEVVWTRESAVLALGAAATGCYEHMREHLPQMFPFLLSQVADSVPQMRSIACWALSRYVLWVVQQPEETHLKPLMEALMGRILDDNKKVQEAACSAFSSLEEDASYKLGPYLVPVVDCLMLAFGKYQMRSLIILYDTVGTLADAVKGMLAQPELVSRLMPPLIGKWQSLDDGDRHLFPLLECLTSIAQALGLAFRDYAEPVFNRCVVLIEKTLVGQAAAQSGGGEAPDKEFIVCSLDLLSGVVEGLGGGAEGLVANSNILALLGHCIEDELEDVRQSACALVGDLARATMARLMPALPAYMPLLIECLDPQYPSVCNNASWAIGEVALKIGGNMAPYVAPTVAKLRPVLTDARSPAALAQNSACTIGRLGLSCPELVATEMPHFCVAMCEALAMVSERQEKENACQGLCLVIKANPSCVVDAFPNFCHAVASWHDPSGTAPVPPELAEMFTQILQGFKSSMPQKWKECVARFPNDIAAYLTTTYSLG